MSSLTEYISLTNCTGCCKIACCTSQVDDDEYSEIQKKEVKSADLVITKPISKKPSTEENGDILIASEDILQVNASSAESSSSFASHFGTEVCNESEATKKQFIYENTKSSANNPKLDATEEHSANCDTLKETYSVIKSNDTLISKESDTSDSEQSLNESIDTITYKIDSEAGDETITSAENNSEESDTQQPYEAPIESSSSNNKIIEPIPVKESTSDFKKPKESLTPEELFADFVIFKESSSSESATLYSEPSVESLSEEDNSSSSSSNSNSYGHDPNELEEDRISIGTDYTLTNSDEDIQNPALEVLDILLTQPESECINYNKEFELMKYKEKDDKWQKINNDAFVVVKKNTFKCHKEILITHSEYFRDSLNGRNNIQALWRIDSEVVTAEAVYIILTYLYEGQMEANCQQIRDIYNTASYLQIRIAIAKCLELIDTSSRQLKNILNLYSFSYQLEHMQEHYSYALQTLALNFEAIVFSNDYLYLNANQIVALFSLDEIDTRSEVVIFMAALKWIEHSFLPREEHAARVLSTVRFDQMSAEELLACHMPPILPGILNIHEVKDKMHDALCFIVAQNSGKEKCFKTIQTKQRNLLRTGHPLNLWDLLGYENCMLEKSAIIIQSAYRGYSARKKVKEIFTVEVRYLLKLKREKQEHKRKLEQHLRALRNNETSVIQTRNKHYTNTMKELFRRKSISSELLE